MAVRSLPDLYLPETPPAPYVPPQSTLSRPTATAINRASAQEVSLTLPGFDEVVPLIFGEARTTGLWLVRPYVASGNLRFAILWSWGEIEGVQAVYLNGQAVSSGHMTHYTGTSTQTVDSTLSGDIAGFADTYKDWAYTVFNIPPGTYTGLPTTAQIEAVVRGIKVNNPAGGGGTETASARYWRIRVTDSHSTDTIFTNFSEIQFRATVGGADQATGGTASASSVLSGNVSSRAFDDDNATQWISNSGEAGPQWIAYDFGDEVDVKEIYLRPGSNGTLAARGPRDFDVQYSSDGGSWTTLDTITGEAAWSASESRTYTLPDVAAPSKIYSANPARCAAAWATSTLFGPGDTITGLEACADRCDELVGGVEVRCEIGLVIDTPQTRDSLWDLFAAYGEFLWSDDGDQVLMVPDAPVDSVAVTVSRDDIVGNTLRLSGEPLSSSPTEVTVIYREPSGGAAQWVDRAASAQAAGVDVGIVTAIRSELRMTGVQRDSEAIRKATIRLRRLERPGRYAWQMYDSGIAFQRGDVVRLPDTRGMTGREVRILSAELVARGIYQITAEGYSASDYPDDYIPGNTTTVPVGGILPYIGAGAAPAGYADFSDANGRFMVGAGSTWARGATFGGTAYTISGNTSTAPNHGAGLPTYSDEQPFIGPSSASMPVYSNAGTHFHSYSVAQDRTPQYVQNRLIVKTGAPGDVPSNAGFWADGEVISAAYEALSVSLGRMQRAGASNTTGGSALSYNLSLGLSSDGAHSHFAANASGLSWQIDFTNIKFSHLFVGNHSHGTSIPVTLSIPRKKLAHYVAGSTFEIVPGAIIGYNGDGALPAGWYNADGSNGTIDTRDYWIERSSPADAGATIAGTRQVTWSGTTALGGQHSHKGSQTNIGRIMSGQIHDTGDAHAHTVSGAVPYDPPSYAMRFIQYTGAV